MIPFFRRIRKQFADDNKPIKYMRYAIGEILLVVIGILIALQVNNWNIEGKNSEKEEYYLKSIKTSIQLSQKELNRVIEDAELISSCADTLFKLIAQNNLSSLKGLFLDSLLFSSLDYSLISLNDGGIQEILNTGSLDLIKDERIRVFLASWNDRMHQIRKFEGESQYLSRNFQEYLLQFVDAKRYLTYPEESIVIPPKMEELLSDPMLTNYLEGITWEHRGMYHRYIEEKAVMDSLTVLINEYLTK